MPSKLKFFILGGGILTLLAAVASLTQVLLKSEIPEEKAVSDAEKTAPTLMPAPTATATAIAKKTPPPPKTTDSDIKPSEPSRKQKTFPAPGLSSGAGDITNAVDADDEVDLDVAQKELEEEEKGEGEGGDSASKFGVIYKPSEEGAEGKTAPSLISSPVECPSGL